MNQNNTLTPQETKVADLVSSGLKNKQVGEQLQISEKTVKFHLTRIYKKLGVTRYQLINRGPASGVTEITSEASSAPTSEASSPAQA